MVETGDIKIGVTGAAGGRAASAMAPTTARDSSQAAPITIRTRAHRGGRCAILGHLRPSLTQRGPTMIPGYHCWATLCKNAKSMIYDLFAF